MRDRRRRNPEKRPVRSHLGAVQELDLALFHAVADSHSPLLDAVLPRLSRAANRSGLWLGASLIIALAGGRFGRRAAMRGLISTAATSAIVNIPAKLTTRRRRPPIDRVPLRRRLARLPTSWSFPSGHSASAAAFAVGASIERPVLAGPLGLLATGVGYSRVYTGVHYPGDVLAGMAIGAAVAAATTRVWPVAPVEPARVRSAFAPLEGTTSDDGHGVVIVVNRASGYPFSGDPATQLQQAFPAAEIVQAEPGDDFSKALEDAVERAAVLGVAGGDGSIGAAASFALAADKPLLVVPAGTLNHLARDLGLATPDDAVRALREGSVVALDVGSIAGKSFLNTASVGSYPELVDARERLEPVVGKWPGVVLGLINVLRRGKPVRVLMNGEERQVWMMFIGNCRYRPHGFAPGWRERLDDGLLDVRYVDGDAPYARTRLVLAVLTGRLGRSRVYHESLERRVSIKCLDGPIRLARDGETFDGPPEFTIEKSARPLAVYLPPAERTNA